jgi:hypothetical protein
MAIGQHERQGSTGHRHYVTSDAGLSSDNAIIRVAGRYYRPLTSTIICFFHLRPTTAYTWIYWSLFAC